MKNDKDVPTPDELSSRKNVSQTDYKIEEFNDIKKQYQARIKELQSDRVSVSNSLDNINEKIKFFTSRSTKKQRLAIKETLRL